MVRAVFARRNVRFRPIADIRERVDEYMMRTILSGPLPYVVAALALAIGGVWFVAAGSVIVIDETGSVEAAFVVNSGPERQRLHGPWRGYFVAVPHMEGGVELRCANRVRKQAGYVTSGVHTTVQVVGRAPCQRLLVGF